MERQPRKDKNSEDQAQAEFEQDLHTAMRLSGWVLPETDEEVAAAEESSAETPPLPSELIDPYAVLQRAQSGPKLLAKVTHSTPEIEANLARAAREGGEIPPDVENLMEADREAAEQKKHGWH